MSDLRPRQETSRAAPRTLDWKNADVVSAVNEALEPYALDALYPVFATTCGIATRAPLRRSSFCALPRALRRVKCKVSHDVGERERQRAPHEHWNRVRLLRTIAMWEWWTFPRSCVGVNVCRRASI